MLRNHIVVRGAGALAIALLALVTAPHEAEAQLIKRIKKAVTDAAEGETLTQLDKLVRGKVRCVFDDEECIRKAEESGQGAVLTDADGTILVDASGNPVTDPKKGAEIASGGRQPTAVAPGEGAWANYDFQPGEEILVFDDFTGDRVGDFPRRFELAHGSFEIIDWQGSRYLRATSNGLFAIPLPRTLPERFTMEYAVHLQHGNAYVRVMPGRAYYGPARTYKGSVASVEYVQAGVRPAVNEGPTVMAGVGTAAKDAVVPVRIMADGKHMKMYLGERRVANVPNAVFPRSDSLFIAVAWASERAPVLIGPIRIAAGGLDLYGRLERDGRVATQGIFFDTNSDRIQPESTPTLREIGTMLQQHPQLRISIEGHTDSDGDDAHNQALSERRAAAVKAALIGSYGVQESRLQSAGFGESRPAADNNTPEGKQQNRRVELVRLDGGD